MNKDVRRLVVGVAGWGLLGSVMFASTVERNLSEYAKVCPATTKPVCMESFDRAIADARAAFAKDPSVVYTIRLDAGVFDLSAETRRTNPQAKAVIDVGDVSPTTGSLNIMGAGMEKTVLITSNSLFTISGFHVSHVHFSEMTFRRDTMTVTQGVVVDLQPGQKGYLSFTVPQGFPSPLDLVRVKDETRRRKTGENYMRAYSNAAVPELLTGDADNTQIAWTEAPTVKGDVWTIRFENPEQPVPASYAHHVACLKISEARPAYIFDDLATGTGTDVGFRHVIWNDQSRGAWRNIEHAYVIDSKILPRAAIHGQSPCLSVPNGGPQFSQPPDTQYPLRYALVDGLVAERTGDDSVAFFNAGETDATSTVRNSTIEGSFARNINLYDSCAAVVPMPQDPGPPQDANHVSGCFDHGREGVPAYYKGCVTDTSGTVRGMGHDKPCVKNYDKVPPL